MTSFHSLASLTILFIVWRHEMLQGEVSTSRDSWYLCSEECEWGRGKSPVLVSDGPRHPPSLLDTFCLQESSLLTRLIQLTGWVALQQAGETF